MKGAKDRAALDKDASLKGIMTAREVSKLTKLLIRWALRDSVKAEEVNTCEVRAFSLGIKLDYSHLRPGGYGA